MPSLELHGAGRAWSQIGRRQALRECGESGDHGYLKARTHPGPASTTCAEQAEIRGAVVGVPEPLLLLMQSRARP